MARGAIVIPGPEICGVARSATPDTESPLKIAQRSCYSTGLKPEAIDTLPPLDPQFLYSRPQSGMGDSARRLFELKAWFDICCTDRRFEFKDVQLAEFRIREQAAHIIGYFA